MFKTKSENGNFDQLIIGVIGVAQKVDM